MEKKLVILLQNRKSKLWLERNISRHAEMIHFQKYNSCEKRLKENIVRNINIKTCFT